MYDRKKRIAELILQELSLALQDVKDPGLAGLMTVTGVEVGKDAKTARIFYSVLGTAAQRASTGKALERAAGFLRRRLVELLSLKVVPRLEFRYDDTAERAQRVEDIIARLHGEG